MEAASEFDTVLLRAVFSDAWPDAASPPQYLRDMNSRYSQLAMGHLSSHGTWVHLYLNGLYWGIYNPSERPDASFLASYLGGEKEEYDVVKHRGLCGPGCASNDSFEVVDGGLDAQRGFQEALNVARTDLRDAENYARFKELVDVENLIDYILLQHYTGNVDWPHKNWYANRQREGGSGWQFYVWDSEYTLRNENDTRITSSNNNTPAFLFSRAKRSPEFQRLFGDRVHKHLFNDGVLQPAANIARYEALAEHIELAIKAEVARWGDNGNTRKGPTNFRYRNWESVRNQVLTRFFPRRHDIAISQLESNRLYPRVDAPTFSQFGGEVDASSLLQMTALEGSIYFTIDGSDPIGPNDAPAGTQYVAAIPFHRDTIVKARTLHDGDWSALVEASFRYVGGKRGDLNNDDQINVDDIDLLCQEIRSATHNRDYDLTNDGLVLSNDLDVLIENIIGTSYGDANLDGVFDTSDFVFVFKAGEYEDDVNDNSTWGDGDWNCDGDFNSSDLITAFRAGGFVNAVVPKINLRAAALFAAIDRDNKQAN